MTKKYEKPRSKQIAHPGSTNGAANLNTTPAQPKVAPQSNGNQQGSFSMQVSVYGSGLFATPMIHTMEALQSLNNQGRWVLRQLPPIGHMLPTISMLQTRKALQNAVNQAGSFIRRMPTIEGITIDYSTLRQ
ncbi:MAG: hypothetical protein Q9226_008562, partial [Calogaya cf. arnoldii]